MYNSRANDTDDSDYTLIADAIRDDPHYHQPRLPQARQKPNDETYRVDRALPDWIQEIEQILEFYRQELQPESNSQSHVHHQFLLRLIDLIRPHYNNDQKKLEHFDKLFQDIIELYERETVQQRNTTEELRKETAYWQRCSLVSTHEHPPRPNAQLVNEDLTELTQSIEQLQKILEAQQSRIKELTELVSMQKASPARIVDPIPPAIETGTLDLSQEDIRRLSRQISNTRDRRCRICQHVFFTSNQ